MDYINVECELPDVYQCGDGKELRMCKVPLLLLEARNDMPFVCWPIFLVDDIHGREDIASFPDPSQPFIARST